MNEAQTMKKLDHKNLVKLYGVCRQEFLIVTEYMAFGSLQDHLVRHTSEKLGLAILVCYAAQVCCTSFTPSLTTDYIDTVVVDGQWDGVPRGEELYTQETTQHECAGGPQQCVQD